MCDERTAKAADPGTGGVGAATVERGAAAYPEATEGHEGGPQVDRDARSGSLTAVATVAGAPSVDRVQRIEGGWRIRSTERFHVDILRMLGGNLRVVTTPVSDPWSYTRAWCYQRPWVEVVLAAAAFDPDEDEEPVGWIKQVWTERRACGWLRKSERREHLGFDPACPDCGNESLA